MSVKIELKPCPFCGGEVQYEEFDDGFFAWGRVKCQCGVMLTTPTVATIKAWNNRVTEADIRAKAIEEFAHELKEKCNNVFPLDFHSSTQYFTLNGVRKLVDVVAEQLKGE